MVTGVSEELIVCKFDLNLQDFRRWPQQVRSKHCYISTSLHTDLHIPVDNCLHNPCTGLKRFGGFQQVEGPRFQDNRHMKVVTLSSLRNGRLNSPGNIPGTNFCQRLNRLQGHSVAGRIKLMNNLSDSKANLTLDLPAYSAVLQPTTPPHAPDRQTSTTTIKPTYLIRTIIVKLYCHCRL